MKPAQRIGDSWPYLPFDQWKDTCATLHLWTQVVGKIRLAKAPMINHWWQVPLYVTCRGLTTSPMPHDDGRSFAIDFDFIDHRLRIDASDGRTDSLALAPCTVADFYAEVMGKLRELGLEVRIWTLPVEIPDHELCSRAQSADGRCHPLSGARNAIHRVASGSCDDTRWRRRDRMRWRCDGTCTNLTYQAMMACGDGNGCRG
jgi:hypothetical protein